MEKTNNAELGFMRTDSFEIHKLSTRKLNLTIPRDTRTFAFVLLVEMKK